VPRARILLLGILLLPLLHHLLLLHLLLLLLGIVLPFTKWLRYMASRSCYESRSNWNGTPSGGSTRATWMGRHPRCGLLDVARHVIACHGTQGRGSNPSFLRMWRAISAWPFSGAPQRRRRCRVGGDSQRRRLRPTTMTCSVSNRGSPR